MGDSIKEIKNVRRIEPIALHREREEIDVCKSHFNLPEGFIPIKVNMIKSPEDYQKCIKCEERQITISTSIMTRKQMKTKNEITDKIRSAKSLNIPVHKKEFGCQRGADDKEVKIHQGLSSQQRSEAESDKSGPGSALEQKVDKENYHEIWDKISSDLDDIIRNTNKCDRSGHNNPRIIIIFRANIICRSCRSKSVPPKIGQNSLHLKGSDWNADGEVTNYQNAFVTQETTDRKGESE